MPLVNDSREGSTKFPFIYGTVTRHISSSSFKCTSCRKATVCANWGEIHGLFLFFASFYHPGLSQYSREFRRIEEGSFFPPSTTSSRTTLRCSATRTLPMGTAGSCGACTSAPPRTGGTLGTPHCPSGTSQSWGPFQFCQ